MLLIEIFSNYHYIVQQDHLSHLMTKQLLVLLACIHPATLVSAHASNMWIVGKCIYCATARSSRATWLLNTHEIICHHFKVTQWTKTEEYLFTSNSSVKFSLLTRTSYWNKLSRSFSLLPLLYILGSYGADKTGLASLQQVF